MLERYSSRFKVTTKLELVGSIRHVTSKLSLDSNVPEYLSAKPDTPGLRYDYVLIIKIILKILPGATRLVK